MTMPLAIRQSRSLRHMSLAPVCYRLGQAWTQIVTSRREVIVPPGLAVLVNERVADAFRCLSPADQLHLIAVAGHLRAAGWGDEVVTAGLLHDIGKGSVGVRITVIDRGLWVVLRRVQPKRSSRLASQTQPPLHGRGIWALARHAEIGADHLADAGYNAEVCWLVRNHEDRIHTDRRLRALIAADEGRFPEPPGIAR